MDIIRSYYILPNKNNRVELIFLFGIGLSRFINKISLIFNKNLLVPRPNMVKLLGVMITNQKLVTY